VENDDFYTSNKCTNKVCDGMKLKVNCTGTDECVPGLYCNSESKQCTNLVVAGKNCTKNDQCVNSASCNNKKCTEYYSLDDGETTVLDRLCKSGKSNKDKCDSIAYGKNMTVDTTSGMVRCNFTANQRCNYKWSSDDTTFDNACECALNEEGSSWCELAVKESK
jgi:hypothetical protein